MNYFDKGERATLKETFEDAVLNWSDVTVKTMFGCPSYQADGTLLVVLVTDSVTLRDSLTTIVNS